MKRDEIFKGYEILAAYKAQIAEQLSDNGKEMMKVMRAIDAMAQRRKDMMTAGQQVDKINETIEGMVIALQTLRKSSGFIRELEGVLLKVSSDNLELCEEIRTLQIDLQYERENRTQSEANGLHCEEVEGVANQ